MRVDVGADLDRLVAELAPGGQLDRVERLTGGVSAAVFRLDLVTAGGERRSVVLREYPERSFKELRSQIAALEHDVLAALHGAGVAVPEPLALDATGGSGDPYLVMEWIDGTTTVADDGLPGALDQMARFLARLHALDVGSLAIAGLPPTDDPIGAAPRYLPDDAVGDAVRVALGRLGAWRPRGTVLVHGDYWPGNILWQDGRLAAVIDWEDAACGDALADLATARVELECANGTDAMERFTRRYRSACSAEIGERPDLRGLPVWEVYVSSAALATMHEWGLSPEAEADRRRRTRRFFERAARDLARSGRGV